MHPLNEEIFKFVVMDLLKCTNDTNMQQSYVGDGKGDIHLAGLVIPPIALTDGSSLGSEILFKHCLHEVKALFDSQAYLKNPSAPETVVAHQEATLLDGITLVANGQSARGTRCTSPTISTSILSIDEDESSEPKKSPAVAMAHASLFSQQAALKEAGNSEALIALQKEELSLQKDNEKQMYEE